MADEVISAEVQMEDDTADGAASAEKNLGGLLDSYVDVSFAIKDLGAVAKVAWDQMAERVELATIQEQAELRYAAALKATGQHSVEQIDTSMALAGEIQRLTGIGDEATLQNWAMSLALGANVDHLEQMSLAAAGAAQAGLNADMIMRGMAISFEGNVGALGRYVPSLRDLTAEELANGAAVEVMAAKYGSLASVEMQTFGGGVLDLSNAWGDLGEELGFFVTKIPSVQGALTDATDLVEQMTAEIRVIREESAPAIDDLVESLIGLTSAAAPASDEISIFGSVIEGVAERLASFSDALTVAIEGAKLLPQAIRSSVTNGEEFVTTFDAMGDAALRWGQRIGFLADSYDIVSELRTLDEVIAEQNEYIADTIALIDDGFVPGLEFLAEKASVAAKSIKEIDDALVPVIGDVGTFGDEMAALSGEMAGAIGDAGDALGDALAGLNEAALAEALGSFDALINRSSLAAMSIDQLWGVVQSMPTGVLGRFREEYAEVMAEIIEGTPGAEKKLRSLVEQMDIAAASMSVQSDLYRLQVDSLTSAVTSSVTIATTEIQDLMASAIAVQAGWAEASEQSAEQVAAAVGQSLLSVVSQVLISASTTIIAKGIEASALQLAGYASITPPWVGLALGLGAAGVMAGIFGGLLGSLPKAAGGGVVTGSGQRGVDSVPIMVAPGEGVIPVPLMDAMFEVFSRQAGSNPHAPAVTIPLQSTTGMQGGGVVSGGAPARPGASAFHIHMPVSVPSDAGKLRIYAEQTLVPVLRDSFRNGRKIRP